MPLDPLCSYLYLFLSSNSLVFVLSLARLSKPLDYLRPIGQRVRWTAAATAMAMATAVVQQVSVWLDQTLSAVAALLVESFHNG